MAANIQNHDMTLRRLQRQIVWSWSIATIALLGVIAIAVGWFASAHANRDGILRTKGIIITDAQGLDRILIGAPALATNATTEKYGRTNSIVFLNKTGGYHLALGQTPAPVVNGKAVGARIGNGDDYGVTLYDTHGNERGGMGFIGGAGRAVIALDRSWPAADAIGLMVDDKSGFAGLGVNYANGNSGFELGIQGDTTSMTFRDPQGHKRANLEIKGPVAPAWKFSNAAAPSSTGKS